MLYLSILNPGPDKPEACACAGGALFSGLCVAACLAWYYKKKITIGSALGVGAGIMLGLVAVSLTAVQVRAESNRTPIAPAASQSSRKPCPKNDPAGIREGTYGCNIPPTMTGKKSGYPCASGQSTSPIDGGSCDRNPFTADGKPPVMQPFGNAVVNDVVPCGHPDHDCAKGAKGGTYVLTPASCDPFSAYHISPCDFPWVDGGTRVRILRARVDPDPTAKIKTPYNLVVTEKGKHFWIDSTELTYDRKTP